MRGRPRGLGARTLAHRLASSGCGAVVNHAGPIPEEDGDRSASSSEVTRAAARIALACALALCACGREAPAPNLVFVTLDTTRADHLGLYGYFRDTSPALDAFGSQAIVFERFIVPMATTLPTHASLFTATQPLEHGVLANSTQGGSRFVPSTHLRSLAEVAGAAGWRTAGFVSSAVLKRGSGIETGFDAFDEPEGEQRNAEATTRTALAWLESTPRGPFLLWVHYFDAHWPYAPPPAYARCSERPRAGRVDRCQKDSAHGAPRSRTRRGDARLDQPL